jgi:hypothetical protein
MGKEETIEKGICPGCGEEVDFRVSPALRGEVVRIHAHEPHKAPCGRPCYEGRDVAMQQTMSGDAHHPRHCECLKEGRGYQ